MTGEKPAGQVSHYMGWPEMKAVTRFILIFTMLTFRAVDAYGNEALHINPQIMIRY